MEGNRSSPQGDPRLCSLFQCLSCCHWSSDSFNLLIRLLSFLPTSTFISSVCVCAVQWQPHLPGLAAPPAGVGGDVQAPAAGLLGQEGELPHGAADEPPQVDGRRPLQGGGLQGDPEQQHAEQLARPPAGGKKNRGSQKGLLEEERVQRKKLLSEGVFLRMHR